MSTERPIAHEATTMMDGRGNSKGRMRPALGLMATLAILLALPIAIGCQILFGSGGGTMIHFALAAACVLLAFSVFDFELPRWVNRIGCVAALALGTIFSLQALDVCCQVYAHSSLMRPCGRPRRRLTRKP
jgi:hypothetical protein